MMRGFTTSRIKCIYGRGGRMGQHGMAWHRSGMGRSYDYEVMYLVMLYQLLQTISTLGVEYSR
jgi:hypothetical protein